MPSSQQLFFKGVGTVMQILLLILKLASEDHPGSRALIRTRPKLFLGPKPPPVSPSVMPPSNYLNVAIPVQRVSNVPRPSQPILKHHSILLQIFNIDNHFNHHECLNMLSTLEIFCSSQMSFLL